MKVTLSKEPVRPSPPKIREVYTYECEEPGCSFSKSSRDQEIENAKGAVIEHELKLHTYTGTVTAIGGKEWYRFKNLTKMKKFLDTWAQYRSRKPVADLEKVWRGPGFYTYSVDSFTTKATMISSERFLELQKEEALALHTRANTLLLETDKLSLALRSTDADSQDCRPA